MKNAPRRHALLWACAAALPLVALLSPTSAYGNGRYPLAERLLEDPADPRRLFLAATYGLVTSTDHGASWVYTCEQAFSGFGLYENDPVLELVAGGAAVVDVQVEINRSTDGCAWTPTFMIGGSGSDSVVDLAVDRTGEIVVALAWTFVGAVGAVSLRESTDAGQTWRAIGTALPLQYPYTVDLDPSDATHIYASGLAADGTGVLAQSTDTGATWSTTSIPGTDQEHAPYIAALSPAQPGRLFVRTDSTTRLADGGSTPDDALLYSNDRGQTWTELFRKQAKLLGFALSPDGTEILAGYGTPDPSMGDPSQYGIYRGGVNGAFSPLQSGQSISCLTWTASGVYACTSLPLSGNGLEEVEFFPTSALSASTPTPSSLLSLGDVKGPATCCAATSVCDWSSDCMLFNTCPSASAGPVSCDSGLDDLDGALEGGGAASSDGRSDDLDGAPGNLYDAFGDRDGAQANAHVGSSSNGSSGCSLAGLAIARQARSHGAALGVALACMAMVRRRRVAR